MSASLKAYKGMRTSFLLKLMSNHDMVMETYAHYPFQALSMTTKRNVSHSRGEHYTACMKGCLASQKFLDQEWGLIVILGFSWVSTNLEHGLHSYLFSF